MGRVQVAQLLLGMLPAELASIGEPEERATEYLHYRQFFTIWEALERVVECRAMEVPQMSRETRAAWVKDYSVGVSAFFAWDSFVFLGFAIVFILVSLTDAMRVAGIRVFFPRFLSFELYPLPFPAARINKPRY